MANNSNRKAIEFMVQGALPPHSTNVLWMDTSIPELPVLKIFENGAWATVHTEQSKIDELLVETIYAQQNEIAELTQNIESKIVVLNETAAKDATVAKQGTNAGATNTAISKAVTDFRHDLMGQGTATSSITPITCLLGFTVTPPASPDVAEKGIIFGHESGGDIEYSFGYNEIQTSIPFKSGTAGERYDYPFGVRIGMELLYEDFGAYYWYLPTQAPDFESFFIDGVVNVGETGFNVIEVTQTPCSFTCLKRVDYYNMGHNTVIKIDEGSPIPEGGVYIGSVFVFKEGIDEEELNLGDIKHKIENLNNEILAAIAGISSDVIPIETIDVDNLFNEENT